MGFINPYERTNADALANSKWQKIKAQIGRYEAAQREHERARIRDEKQLDLEWDEWWEEMQSLPCNCWHDELEHLIVDWQRREFSVQPYQIEAMFAFLDEEIAFLEASDSRDVVVAEGGEELPPASAFDQVVVQKSTVVWVSFYNGDEWRQVVGEVDANDERVTKLDGGFDHGFVFTEALRETADVNHLLADAERGEGPEFFEALREIVRDLKAEYVAATGDSRQYQDPSAHERESVWLAAWEGFFKGGRAGFWEVVKNLSFEYVGVEEAEAAWKEAGLDGTLTQTISQVSSIVAREALVAVFTAGAAQAAGKGLQVSQHADEVAKILGGLKEVYETVEDAKQIAEAVEAAQAGDFGTAAVLVGALAAEEVVGKLAKKIKNRSAGGGDDQNLGVVAGGELRAGRPTNMHHTIPKEIQGKLRRKVRTHPDVVGRRGLPNRKKVDAEYHQTVLHDKKGISRKETGISGGRYNLRFHEEIENRGGYGDVDARDIIEIRDKLVDEFGI